MELTDFQFGAFTLVCNKLVIVSLSFNLCVTDNGIINGIFGNCHNLEHFELIGCNAVQGVFLTKLPFKLKHLVWAYFVYVMITCLNFSFRLIFFIFQTFLNAYSMYNFSYFSRTNLISRMIYLLYRRIA